LQICAATSWTFSALGSPKAKAVLLGPIEPVSNGLIEAIRSFPIEHVSPDLLVQQEISRQSPGGMRAIELGRQGSTLPDSILLPLFRRWFWSRKPDAGFLLSLFPATMLHALLLDEWLEARGEALTTCLLPFSGNSVQDCAPQCRILIEHYRSQGLLGRLVAGPA
jgi:adenylate kinase